MQVTCHNKDTQPFEELGFSIDDQLNGGNVLMIDEEANYGHWEQMPNDVVYFGLAGPGGCYDAFAFACDGNVYTEVPCLQDGPAVKVSENGCIDSEDLEREIEGLKNDRNS
jgi:hypothetical protein